ncbi:MULTISPECIES: hypothetical protein [Bacteroides]|jgi:hypothetical protein|uniref:Uncharacterized protein n=2 Tax=Bacteroides fragilis TaxID=817 RepID=A0A413JTK4_BACFG|nr:MULTISPECIES: hypothetical protein [Bacteroides]MBG9215187.1 hypothetical protein [Bacteroides fragilis]MBG9225992.1 hypothetical protein [Bacteroides fragilis]MBY2893833.1 hypothetical protein [Bacteroides fragilis]MCM0225245.1 hypothetical protein [Bacteroides fragilis]MCM0360156.1 hypothetical protein [Bacteroides fragilis]
MSIVIGIINEKGVTISADTKLANIKIPTQYQSGLKKIFHFQLDGLNYIFGCAGPNVMELITFLRILQKYPFTLAEGYSQKDFMKCIQTILKDNKINSLMTLWGCISDKQPQLWMISSAQMEMLSQGYAIFPPHGTQVYARQLMDSYFQKKHKLYNENLLDFLYGYQLELGKKSKFEFIDDDFYYHILDINNNVITPSKSRLGKEVSLNPNNKNT